ncbi:3'-5' exonuclease-like [Magnolia sinica]|uniref:3'-5' exonuclease-like n=1 Tax=Magnolia sinica TaxID=86752 RepID=UPI00265A75AE|nr:3'-5' exonuclease-like [Magnolia sinica]
MTITIQQNDTTDTHSIYTVNFFNCPIITTVTNVGSVVESWLSDIYRIHSRRLAHLIVGLDIEWRPIFQRNATSRVALLQLCVGRRCLIFQLIYADCIPQSLRNFLLDQNFRFVGVGIEEDVEKLLEDYELSVANPVDLRLMAAEKLDAIELRRAGLKNLASATLGLEVVKPKRVTMSRWDSSWLSFEQVQYACVDAHLSFEIGKYLILMN